MHPIRSSRWLAIAFSIFGLIVAACAGGDDGGGGGGPGY
jgi:hypothetical protein